MGEGGASWGGGGGGGGRERENFADMAKMNKS